MKKIILTVQDCKDVLDREILIGTDVAYNMKPKKFTFNTWKNRYTVWYDGEAVECDEAVEELLEEYNDL
ncbi:hypothetical protein M0R04_15020 [Candidatus Dojkabacteria bacterium]|jgi:hypothetical protein|nr:hypothetical protein [Candidatus Dojkabacteria bacterium]